MFSAIEVAQKPPLYSTLGLLLDTFLEGLRPFLPETLDEQFRNWIIDKLSSFGMNLGEGILGELLEMTMFNQSAIIALMNDFSMGAFPATGIEVGDPAVLEYELNQ